MKEKKDAKEALYICSDPTKCPKDTLEACMHSKGHARTVSCEPDCIYGFSKCIPFKIPVLDKALGLEDEFLIKRCWR